MCSLFGMIDYGRSLTGKQKTRILAALGKECEERGTDAAGVAYNHNGTLRIYKRPLPARKLRFRVPNRVSVVMGHTRMTTQGDAKFNRNNHPFPGAASGAAFALAHNGVLYNDDILKIQRKLPRTDIETDSYVAVQLIEQHKALNFDSLRYMAEEVEGSFCFTVLNDQDQVYIVKGDNPLCLYHWPRLGLYLYASTEDILKRTLRKTTVALGQPVKVPLDCGEILKIDQDGQMEKETFCFRFGFYWPRLSVVEDAYLEDLKTAAQYCGYDGKLVDRWLREGFTTDEIEEFLYTGMMEEDDYGSQCGNDDVCERAALAWPWYARC